MSNIKYLKKAGTLSATTAANELRNDSLYTVKDYYRVLCMPLCSCCALLCSCYTALYYFSVLEKPLLTSDQSDKIISLSLGEARSHCKQV